MKQAMKWMLAILTVITVLCCAALPAFADEVTAAPETAAAAEAQPAPAEEAAKSETSLKNVKAISAAAVLAAVASAGAIGMALSISKSADGIARQPEAAGNIRTTMMLGLVFIETGIIYALIVAILIIFVL